MSTHATRTSTGIHDNHRRKNEQHIGLSERMRQLANRTHADFFLELVQIVLSLLFTAIYIADSYYVMHEADYTWLLICDLAISPLLVLLFLWKFAIARNRLRFLFSGSAILDYVTVLPVMAIDVLLLLLPSFQDALHTLKVLSVLRVLRLLRVLYMTKKDQNDADETAFASAMRKLFVLMMTIASLLVLFAGMFQVFENVMRSTEEQVPFHEALFFTFTALSTLAYGVIPKTYPGKIVLVIFWFLGALIIPIQSSKLIAIVVKHKITLGKVVRVLTGRDELNNHIVISGSSTVSELRHILVELSKQNDNAHRHMVLVLRDEALSEQVNEVFQSDDELTENLKIITGDILNANMTHRINLDRASTVCLLASTLLENYDVQDEYNILMTANIRNFNAKVKIITQVTLSESKPYALGAGANICICQSDLRDKIISMNALMPGLSTLMYNLIHANLPSSLSNRIGKHLDDDLPWRREYIAGSRSMFFVEDFSSHFQGMPFPDVVNIVYDEIGAICVGTKQRDSGAVTLNPQKDYRIDTTNDQAILIAHKSFQSTAVSRYASHWTKNRVSKVDVEVHENDLVVMDELSDNGRQSVTVSTERENSTRKDENFAEIDGNESSFALERLFGSFFLDQWRTGSPIPWQILARQFKLLEKPRSKDDIVLSFSDNAMDFNNHIIILGDLSISLSVMLRLVEQHRHIHDAAYTTTVLLFEDEKQIDALCENGLGFFPHVFALRASQSIQSDLHHLKTESARRIIFNTPQQWRIPSSSSSLVGNVLHDITADTYAVKIAMVVQALHRSAQFHCVVSSTNAIQFFKTSRATRVRPAFYETGFDMERDSLCDTLCNSIAHLWSKLRRILPSHSRRFMRRMQEIESSTHLNPLFASGRVFSTCFFSLLSARAVFNDSMTQIVDTLVAYPVNNHTYNQLTEEFERFGPHLGQVDLPRELEKGGSMIPFGNVFHHMLTEEGLVCIGIYRAGDTRRGNEFEYVVANPSEDTLVESGDKIFVITK